MIMIKIFHPYPCEPVKQQDSTNGVADCGPKTTLLFLFVEGGFFSLSGFKNKLKKYVTVDGSEIRLTS